MTYTPMVDAHHHLWDLAVLDYPWLTMDPPPDSVAGDLRPIQRSYLIGDYLKDIDGENVVKSVHVEAGSTDPVAETAWLQNIADRHGFPHGIVAAAELAQPNLQAILEAHLKYPNVRGIRQIVAWHRDPAKTYVDDRRLLEYSRWLAGLGLLAGYGLSFDLQVYPSQMESAARVAHAFPNTQMVLVHTGLPADREPEQVELWQRGLRLLAVEPNVAVKISGLGMVDWQWTVESIRPFVLDAIEAFGVDRAMFGSNFAVDRLYSDYHTVLDAFRQITQGFSPSELSQLFHDNAVRIYRL